MALKVKRQGQTCRVLFDSQNQVMVHHYITSNVTGRHRGPKHKRMFVCRYVAPPGECYYNYYVALTIFHRRMWNRALSLPYTCI